MLDYSFLSDFSNSRLTWPLKFSGSLPDSLHHPFPGSINKTFALALRGYIVCLLSEDPGAAHGGQDGRHQLGTGKLQGHLSASTGFPCEGLSVHRLNNWALSQRDARWTSYSMVDTLSSCSQLFFVSCSGKAAARFSVGIPACCYRHLDKMKIETYESRNMFLLSFLWWMISIKYFI